MNSMGSRWGRMSSTSSWVRLRVCCPFRASASFSFAGSSSSHPLRKISRPAGTARSLTLAQREGQPHTTSTAGYFTPAWAVTNSASGKKPPMRLTRATRSYRGLQPPQ
ncbi:Uncharacterised protein [Flavonifractor plautii]|uniref:Uncharacterized protein n=1 Tax=Flavonifractor plautii TaxID=292800 RepID=A0A174H5R2_FLAPL|nr:Uncharacterised protein [Flavonifractor plautii]